MTLHDSEEPVEASALVAYLHHLALIRTNDGLRNIRKIRLGRQIGDDGSVNMGGGKAAGFKPPR
jgi:hypothetical protein